MPDYIIEAMKWLSEASKTVFFIVIGVLLTIIVIYLYNKFIKSKFNKLPCESHSKEIEKMQCTNHKEEIKCLKDDHSNGFEKLKDNLSENKIQIAVIDTKIATIETKIDNLKETQNTKVEHINQNIEWIKQLLTGKAELPFMQKHSPISFTEEGKILSDELQLQKLVDDNWDTILFNLEENIEGKNPYDIQLYCMNTAGFNSKVFFKNEEIENIKTEAFKRGHNVEILLRMAGLIIRDKYFQAKEMDILEIDRHDPGNQ